MTFDLVVHGGHLLDPHAGRNGPHDVGVSAGRIAVVDDHIPAGAGYRAIDAAGLFVLPGLIDLHTHVFHGFTYWGLDPDVVAPGTGVTTWVDAGSAGAFGLNAFREHVAAAARVRVRAFVNVSYLGLVGPEFELSQIAYCDEELLEHVVRTSRDLVVGVKVRMGSPTVGPNGLRPLETALAVAQRCDCPVMVHIADAPPAISSILDLLRPGDIVTHCATGGTMRLVDDKGAPLDATRRAVDRGVVLDVGHGSGSMAFPSAEGLLAAGLGPAVLSTDLHQMSIHGRGIVSNDAATSAFISVRDDVDDPFDLPTCMSKFLAMGVSLIDVVRATTERPSAILGMAGRVGTLAVGATADLATFRLEEGSFNFTDVEGSTRPGTQRLRNVHTVIRGRLLAPPPEATSPAWVRRVPGNLPDTDDRGA